VTRTRRPIRRTCRVLLTSLADISVWTRGWSAANCSGRPTPVDVPGPAPALSPGRILVPMVQVRILAAEQHDRRRRPNVSSRRAAPTAYRHHPHTDRPVPTPSGTDATRYRPVVRPEPAARCATTSDASGRPGHVRVRRGPDRGVASPAAPDRRAVRRARSTAIPPRSPVHGAANSRAVPSIADFGTGTLTAICAAPAMAVRSRTGSLSGQTEGDGNDDRRRQAPRVAR